MRAEFANAAKPDDAGRDRPWLFRTYSGHTSAAESNALYRTNLARGQTGLSVAFDLPTQTAYDSDHPLAAGEVGRVGVPVCHLGDMETLFKDIPLERMNTSMTINAPAGWLLALYIACAERQGVAPAALAGTTQNDIIKEYLSRGTYIFPPGPSMKLTADVIAFTCREMPKWNPVNVCSYHLQEAGATPVLEIAFTLANAVAILNAVRDSGQVAAGDFPAVVGRTSFFVNAGMRFITEICKLRAFTDLWDEITAERYAVDDAKLRRFRYGVQVNSLGLTEQQPENNVYRILLEMLAVVLSKDSRARAVQLPAWNEALGLPNTWDQQWSLRLQQIVAYETDLLDHDDIFRGSRVIAGEVARLKAAALDELAKIEAAGGAIQAVKSGYMKQRLVAANADRTAAIEDGRQVVVGVNAFVESAPSPLSAAAEKPVTLDPRAEARQVERLRAWRQRRDEKQVAATLAELDSAARAGANVMPPSIACARAGVTTGEWGATLRAVYGEYRAPTGIAGARAVDVGAIAEVRAEVERLAKAFGRRPKILIGKPGLDGHSNGAEQVAIRARDAGLEVIYSGIRLTPAEIVRAAIEEGVHAVGLSVLSGAHLMLVREVVDGLRSAGLDDVPVVVGGIIPKEDAQALLEAGVARIFSPKDFKLTEIVGSIVGLIGEYASAA